CSCRWSMASAAKAAHGSDGCGTAKAVPSRGLVSGWWPVAGGKNKSRFLARLRRWRGRRRLGMTKGRIRFQTRLKPCNAVLEKERRKIPTQADPAWVGHPCQVVGRGPLVVG